MDSEGRVLAEDDNHEHSSINSLCPKSFNLTRTASALHDSSNGKTDIALGNTEDGLLLYAALPYTPDWKLCIFTSRSVVYASLDQVRNIALFTWSAMLVSALLFSLCRDGCQGGCMSPPGLSPAESAWCCVFHSYGIPSHSTVTTASSIMLSKRASSGYSHST